MHPFRCELLAATEMPQRLIYLALHNDYSETFSPTTELPEDRCGQIAVKRLLEGNRGHYGCYSADTLVMTERGWVAWPQIATTDRLLAVDIESGASRFETPSALWKQRLEPGDGLYSARSQRIDLCVTHDHRMVVSSRGKSGWTPWRVESAKDIAGRAVRYRTTTELDEDQRQLPADLPPETTAVDALRVAGFYFGDGVRSASQVPQCLRFRLRRQRKIDYLAQIGTAVGLLEPMTESRYTLRCGPLAAWVETHFKSATGKTVPTWLLRLPRAEFLAFLDGLRHSDGTKFRTTARSGTSWSLDSTEYQALRLIQAASHLNGIATNLYLNQPNQRTPHQRHRPCWRLSFSHNRPFARFEASQEGRTRGTESFVEPNDPFVYCASVSTGALLVSRNGKPVVSGNCLEHPQLSLLLKVDHNTAMQLRTHRVGLSFDIQSMRYTGSRIEQVAKGTRPLDEVFYVRPAATYHDRQGDKYNWSENDVHQYKTMLMHSAQNYALLRSKGVSEEHARGVLPTCYFQNVAISGNLRAWLHLLDVRLKADAQDEIRWAMELAAQQVQRWVPEIYSWYSASRKGKAQLAP